MFPCYAYKLANGRLRQRYLDNHNVIPNYRDLDSAYEDIADPFYPRFWSERLKEPYRIKKPIGLFLDDMSDWMGDYWPREWTEAELQMMRDNPQHRIYTLTKQPNLIKFSPFPENCWVGVTATNPHAFWQGVITFQQITAQIKFISFEPLLKLIPIQIPYDLEMVDWVIIGAQTKPLKLPQKAWIDEIVDACRKVGIPYFLKDNLRPLLGNDLIQDMPFNNEEQELAEMGLEDYLEGIEKDER